MNNDLQNKTIIIIGGGISGLAAAISLLDAGFNITLIEKRNVLGGRASSYFQPDSKEWVDNCQHILLECCTNLIHFYKSIDALSKIQFYDGIHFLTKNITPFELKASRLPAPLHLMPSLLKMPLLKVKDKLLLLWGMFQIFLMSEKAVLNASDITIKTWLQKHHQTEHSIKYFWEPVLISALNETLEKTSAKYAFKAIRETFLKNKSGYRMGVPTVPLSDLYTKSFIDAVQEKNCAIHFSKQVQQYIVKKNRITAIEFADGSQMTADYYMSAVPQQKFLELLPHEIINNDPVFAGIKQIETTPIIGIHLWFDRAITKIPFAALTRSTIQWFFQKTHKDGQYLSCVISASDRHLQKSKNELVETALNDLIELFPNIKEAKLLKSVVMKEAHATFSITPEIDKLRPSPRTSIENLYLAGDWIQNDWPATMEAAVKSGYLASEALLSDLGIPKKLLQADLPSSGLWKWIKG